MILEGGGRKIGGGKNKLKGQCSALKSGGSSLADGSYHQRGSAPHPRVITFTHFHVPIYLHLNYTIPG